MVPNVFALEQVFRVEPGSRGDDHILFRAGGDGGDYRCGNALAHEGLVELIPDLKRVKRVGRVSGEHELPVR